MNTSVHVFIITITMIITIIFTIIIIIIIILLSLLKVTKKDYDDCIIDNICKIKAYSNLYSRLVHTSGGQY